MARNLLKRLRVTCEWIAAHTVSAAHESYDLEKYMASSGSPGIYEQLGIRTPFRINSTKLLPRPSFHQIVTKDLPGLKTQRARLAYHSAALADGFPGDITSISAFLFRGRVLVTRIRAMLDVEFASDVESTIASLVKLRSAKQIPAVGALIRATAGAVEGRPRRPSPTLSFDQYFAMRIAVPGRAWDIDEMVRTLRPQLAALLIGTHNAHMLKQDLVDRVFDSNRELNVKAAGEHLLLNRQGFVYLLPEGRYHGPHRNRFERTRDLATLATYARIFLSEGHSYHAVDRAAADDVVRRIGQWVQQSDTTFDASVSQTLSWAVLARELQLEERLSAWREYFSDS